MESSIKTALIICPNYNITHLITAFYNLTKFSNPTIEVPQFLCAFQDAIAILKKQESLSIFSILISICLGVPSSIFSLLIFSTKPFRTVSCFYHLAINVIELLYSLLLLDTILSTYEKTSMQKSWLWNQFRHYVVLGKIDIALPITVQILVVWMAIERTLLCNSTHLFAKINRMPVACSAIFVAFVLSLLYALPNWFRSKLIFNNTTQIYDKKLTEFGASEAYFLYVKIRGLIPFVQLAILGAASILTLIGLWQSSNRKKRLIIGTPNFQSASAKQRGAANKQLCLLQVCEAVPTLVTSIFMVCIAATADRSYRQEELLQTSYVKATNYLRHLEIRGYLSMFGIMSQTVEHGTHFYRYLLFSKKVRNSVKSWFVKINFRRKK